MAEESKNKRPNRLIHERSPYLLQHAYNPVDWYPWGKEAFERAKREDAPIFLSIGYSTCHWCHVMENESFEDREVASLMNEAFVCVKVDREERPDIDSVYMSVCQHMTGTGGWPLTIIMTPDRIPFFAATYLPKTSRFGVTGMLDLIPRIREIWRTRRHEAESIGEQVKASLVDTERDMQGASLGKGQIDEVYGSLVLSFDEMNGGFGTAPKFPTPQNMLFLLRYWKRTKQKLAVRMVEKTLRAMRGGGIYDQIGFGFHRYSTDSRWLLPHFEKMLYDQALLAMAYVECFQAIGDEEYKLTAEEILEYVIREMTSPEGGFYSAEDADSEGEEGKFYFWTKEQVRDALSDDGDTTFATKIFSISSQSNFKESSKTENGKNVLHYSKAPEELAVETGVSLNEFQNRLSDIRPRLFLEREKRVHPDRDDKILADWNGLMIAAFAKAAQVFDEEKYRLAARRSADFILEKMKDKGGKLFHRYRQGEVYVDGFLDDYAFLSWGLIELYEACFETKYLQSALELTETIIENFWDKSRGGFYQTAEDAEEVLLRNKQLHDGALPSGNSVETLNLLRLARLTANIAYEEYANKTMQAFSRTVAEMPEAHVFTLLALDFALGPTYEIIVVGNPDTDDTRSMLDIIRKSYVPNGVALFLPYKETTEKTPAIFAHVADYKPIGGKATAYVCQNQICKQPTNEVSKLMDLLNA